VRCSVLQCVAVCCSVLQCVAACCSVLQCVAERWGLFAVQVYPVPRAPPDCVEVCCSALKCVAVCWNVLQCVAVRWSVLQCVALYWDLIPAQVCPGTSKCFDAIASAYTVYLCMLSGYVCRVSDEYIRVDFVRVSLANTLMQLPQPIQVIHVCWMDMYVGCQIHVNTSCTCYEHHLQILRCNCLSLHRLFMHVEWIRI